MCCAGVRAVLWVNVTKLRCREPGSASVSLLGHVCGDVDCAHSLLWQMVGFAFDRSAAPCFPENALQRSLEFVGIGTARIWAGKASSLPSGNPSLEG